MRVAVVTMDTHHTVDTARTRRLLRLTNKLQDEEDVEVVVCCVQWWGGDVDSFEHDGVTYRRVTSDRSARRFGLRLPLVLRGIDPDVVHASYWPPGTAVAAASTRWLGRTPVILDWYGDEPVDSDRRTTRSAIRLPTALVTPSVHVETVVRELGAADGRTHVIPDGIDLSLVRSQSPADGPDVVTARRLDEHANVDMMLLGLAELRDRDWSAMVIGDGPARAAYEQKAAELRIDDRVSFPGDLPREQMIAHFKAAHVFVQTAERCPFARELLYALACGCVGVVDYQEHSAAHELVEAFGRSFRTTDSEELSEAIVSAGDLEELSYYEGFESYDWPTVLDRMLGLYDDVLA